MAPGTTVVDLAANSALNYGYGPMNDTDFEEALSGAVTDVGGDCLNDWAGQAILGWVQHELTCERVLSPMTYGFGYEFDGAGEPIIDDECLLTRDDNAG